MAIAYCVRQALSHLDYQIKALIKTEMLFAFLTQCLFFLSKATILVSKLNSCLVKICKFSCVLGWEHLRRRVHSSHRGLATTSSPRCSATRWTPHLVRRLEECLHAAVVLRLECSRCRSAARDVYCSLKFCSQSPVADASVDSAVRMSPSGPSCRCLSWLGRPWRVRVMSKWVRALHACVRGWL